MTMREKLVDILCKISMEGQALVSGAATLADILIEKGVVVQKHGRWILEREPDGTPYCFHCSVCDDDFHCIGITVMYDYCPNCGAKMDLEEKKDDV